MCATDGYKSLAPRRCSREYEIHRENNISYRLQARAGKKLEVSVNDDVDVDDDGVDDEDEDDDDRCLWARGQMHYRKYEIACFNYPR